MEAEDALVDGASAHVGVVDASIDEARFDAHGGRFADPLARDLDARALDELFIGTEQPLDSAMSTVALSRPAHRSDDGVSSASRGRVGDALPNRAVGAALELAQLLTVIGDISEKARGNRGRTCGGGLQWFAENGANDDLAEAAIVAGKEARRAGRVHSLLGSQSAREHALSAKAQMGKGIRAQGVERGRGLGDGEARSANNLENALLALELQPDALDASARVVYPASTIAVRVAHFGSLGGAGGGVEQSNKLNDGRSPGGEALSLVVGVSAPLPGT